MRKLEGTREARGIQLWLGRDIIGRERLEKAQLDTISVS